MKYIAILRTSRNNGIWNCPPTTSVKKSDLSDEKKDVENWLEDEINKLNEEAKEDNSTSYMIRCKTILAISEEDSTNINDFFETTYY